VYTVLLRLRRPSVNHVRDHRVVAPLHRFGFTARAGAEHDGGDVVAVVSTGEVERRNRAVVLLCIELWELDRTSVTNFESCMVRGSTIASVFSSKMITTGLNVRFLLRESASSTRLRRVGTVMITFGSDDAR
jgi:hypothetical protein